MTWFSNRGVPGMCYHRILQVLGDGLTFWGLPGYCHQGVRIGNTTYFSRSKEMKVWNWMNFVGYIVLVGVMIKKIIIVKSYGATFPKMEIATNLWRIRCWKEEANYKDTSWRRIC